MKTITPALFVDPSKKTSEAATRHIQSLTDDMRGVLAGGLSFFDKQLPFEYREISVISGVQNFIFMQAPYTIKGCIPIQSNGATILNFQSNFINNKFSVTLTLDTTSPIVIGFLLIGILV